MEKESEIPRTPALVYGMKRVVLWVLLACLTLAGEGDREALIAKLVEAGKPYGLSRTLLAIAKVESNFGQVKINLQDPSCGVTMIHVRYFLKRYNIKDEPFRRNMACQQLTENDDLAIAEAVAILEFWKTKHCGKWGCKSNEWAKVWASYNAGNNWDSKAGRAYALKIKNAIKGL